MFEGKYVMWGAEHSMFSRKLQAMLNYVGIDFDFCLKSEEKGAEIEARVGTHFIPCLLYTSPSPRDRQKSRMPSSA